MANHNLKNIYSILKSSNRYRYFCVILVCVILQLFHIQIGAQSNLINLDMKNVSIEDVLKSIESKTSYRFLYNKQIIDVARRVNVQCKKQDVSQLLNQIFKGYSVIYIINGKQIVLKKKRELKKVCE